MASICGLNISASNLTGELTSKLSGFLNLSGTLGKKTGIGSLSGILGDGLSSIQGLFSGMLPSIPNFESGFSSLGDELGGIIGSVGDFTSGIGGFLSKYAGLKDFSGFANFDLNNLANSAFSLGANFDPCSIDIPKIFSDADGGLSQGSQSPSIGAVEAGGIAMQINQKVSDMVGTIASGNLPVIPTFDSLTGFTDIASIQNIMDGGDGIFPNFDLKGMTDVIKKLPTGEQIFEGRDVFNLNSLKKAVGTITTPGALFDEETQDYPITLSA